MKKFLEYVAEDIIGKYGLDLSQVAVVFPNKRAALFINEHLARIAGRPIWSPAYITISDFFRHRSTLMVADQIKLICEMHKSFTACTGIDETLDHFFGWGQLLLADFDDIDKNMANAADVFRNVENLHELDDISYLDEEQRDVLKRFFSNFTDSSVTELKRRFLRLWCRLGDIYDDFRQRLRRQGLAYEGMLYRDVAESGRLDCQYDVYLFVGFNVIQEVEQRVFSMLQKEGRARFYWDFDDYYMPKGGKNVTANEAGHYISQFIKYFPNELDTTDKDIYGNFSKDKNIRYFSSPTEDMQARYVKSWLLENDRYKAGKNTAIVLCNESLLTTVTHCIPKEVDSLNITTGFPLFQTPVTSLVARLLELRIDGYSRQTGTYRLRHVAQVLSHPYSVYISKECDALLERLKAERIFNPEPAILMQDDGLRTLFGGIEDGGLMRWLVDMVKLVAMNSEKESGEDPLRQESLFRMYTLCNRLDSLVSSGDLAVDAVTLQRLVMQLANSTSIPFHGEPAVGIQIMGILETRNLDFDNVLILSCNEGNMPKGIDDSSFIPYSVRKAYGLTTIDNKVAIYAYYFYNLLQRATDITIVYNNSTVNGSTGEMSRFMLQLMVESRFDIGRFSLQAGHTAIRRQPEGVSKDGNVMAVLKGMKSISPTSINRYMRCQMQFFYNDVAGLKEDDSDELEEMSNRIFGNVFHLASELLYKEIARDGGLVVSSGVKYALAHRELLERIVDQAFAETVFTPQKAAGRRIEYNGLQLINREVIIKYLRRLLAIDERLTPFRIKDTEGAVYRPIAFKTSEGERVLSIGGRIDRLDQVVDKRTGAETLRVIDYKTGRAPQKKIGSVEEVFSVPVDAGKHADYFLQAMLYSMIVRRDARRNSQGLAVSPALLFIQKTSEEDYDPTIVIGKSRVTDIADFEEEFNERLKTVLSEIFEPQIPFTPTPDRNVCEYCPYRNLCGG